MFTGIIEIIGKVEKIDKSDQGLKITINADKFFEDKKIGGSIAIDGVCLTITAITPDSATFEVMEETTSHTTFSQLKETQEVNLEAGMRLGDRFDGHLVQGHVDTTAEVLEKREEKTQTILRLKTPLEQIQYFALKGSITINGVSLTISKLTDEYFEVSLIPHTLENTNLSALEPGNQANLEFDAIAKHVEALLNKKEGETKYFYLKDRGFI
jgi:riboflavin synthase